MPSCIQCGYYDKESVKCSLRCDKGGRSYLRNCVYAIARQEIPLCKGNVLEVGGGHWPYPRRTLRAIPECKYFGIDPKWANCARIGGYKGTASHIPFEDNFFDMILAFETMEHWAEYKESPEMGLKEIHRVLKPNGGICITVPIHLHGAKEFIMGDLITIKSYFSTGLWKDVRYEEWRKDYEPLPPSRSWVGKLENFRKWSTQKEPSSWTFRINAEKA